MATRDLPSEITSIDGRVTTIEGSGGGGGAATYVNVKDHSVTGDGTTDDTTALNACIAAAATGSTIYFPPGTYVISAPIVMKDGCRYLGAGRSTSAASRILQKNSANITGPNGRTGLFVSAAFANDAATCSLPVQIEGLAFDGNKDNNGSSNASGVVLNGYWSKITDCYFVNHRYAGVLLTDYTNDGTYVSNSCSENRLTDLKIVGCLSSGIEQESGNGNSNLDGFISDCLITEVGDGIYMSNAAGWSVRRNHLYGVQYSGIHLGRCFGTTVTENYIEDYGSENTPGGYYKGIDMTVLDLWPSFCTTNFVANQITTGTAHFRNFQINAAYDAQARVVISGNIAVCNSSGIDTKAFYLDRSGAGVLTAQLGGNIGFGAQTEWYIDGSCVTEWSGNATDSNVLNFAAQSSNPATPSSGLLAYNKPIASRNMLRVIGPSGLATALQPALFDNNIYMVSPGTSTAPLALGGPALSAVGTVSHPTLASTSLRTSSSRWSVVSAATANSAAEQRAAFLRVWRGNAAGRGGFFLRTRFVIAAGATNQRGFIGLTSSTAALSTSLDPGTLTNIIGIGFQSTNTELSIMHNDASGTATKVGLGATNFAPGNDNVYELSMFAPPWGSDVKWEVQNLNSGVTATGTITTDLPAATQFLGFRLHLNNGGDAAAVTYDCLRVYLETDI